MLYQPADQKHFHIFIFFFYRGPKWKQSTSDQKVLGSVPMEIGIFRQDSKAHFACGGLTGTLHVNSASIWVNETCGCKGLLGLTESRKVVYRNSYQ